jgi:hypothetical protein
LVIDITNFYNIENIPWMVKIGKENSEEISQIKWNGLVVSVEGLYNKGKTFVLNNLIKVLKEKFNNLNTEELLEGSTTNTEGLSFKFVECKGKSENIGEEYIFLDTAGFY